MNLQSDNINELISALSKAQGRIISAKKDKKNPYFKSSYADLSSIWDACRTALSENGIAVVQSVQVNDQKMELITTLGHASGQWMKSQMPIITTKSDPQSIGSALTYYRRYTLAAMVGVAPSEEDDDGNMATEPNGNYKASAKTEPMPKATISKEQGNELVEILGTCDVKYQESVMKTVKSFGFNSLYEISEDVYARIKTAALKKHQESMAMEA